MNATDSEERVKEGFRALLQRLEGDSLPDPETAKRENAAAFKREQARVRTEYARHGLVPPSPFALSITALRDMAKREEERASRQQAPYSEAAE